MKKSALVPVALAGLLLAGCATTPTTTPTSSRPSPSTDTQSAQVAEDVFWAKTGAELTDLWKTLPEKTKTELCDPAAPPVSNKVVNDYLSDEGWDLPPDVTMAEVRSFSYNFLYTLCGLPVKASAS